jgi:predicted dehydrogenase
MRIAVIGLGSMGRRRIRILRKLHPELELVGVDPDRERREQAGQEFELEVRPELGASQGEAPADAVLVCSAPESHAALFGDLLPRAVHTFSEIDLLTDGYDRLIEAENGGARRHFLSSTPLYDAEVRHITRCAQEGGRCAYRYHVGQYLPDWHPWEDYRGFFASRKKTNGCREILAIELPWMVRAFGAVQSFRIQRSRLTDLEIDFDDSYQLLLQHAGGVTGSFHVDVVCRFPVHHLEVYSERAFLSWEGSPGSLRTWNASARALEPVPFSGAVSRVAGYAEMITENPYEEELNDFLAGLADPRHRFAHSYRSNRAILELIEKMETSP